MIGIRDEKWGERPLACVVPEEGEELERRRHPRLPRRPRREVVDPRVVRVHRRGPEDVGRQVLQEDAARAVLRGRHVVAISQEELQLAARNHGMPLEALRWDVTPLGLHYLLIHYDIPVVDAASWRLEVGGRVDAGAVALARGPARAAGGHARGDDGVRGQRARAAGAARRLASRGCSRRSAPPSGRACRCATCSTRRASPDDAVEVLFTGLDRGVEGGVEQAYQRSLTLDEAGDGPLLAYAINGEPLPPQHGFPLRLVVPGWYGMTSVKWLARIDADRRAVRRLPAGDRLPDPRARGRSRDAGDADHAARADGRRRGSRTS